MWLAISSQKSDMDCISRKTVIQNGFCDIRCSFEGSTSVPCLCCRQLAALRGRLRLRRTGLAIFYLILWIDKIHPSLANSGFVSKWDEAIIEGGGFGEGKNWQESLEHNKAPRNTLKKITHRRGVVGNFRSWFVIAFIVVVCRHSFEEVRGIAFFAGFRSFDFLLLGRASKIYQSETEPRTPEITAHCRASTGSAGFQLAVPGRHCERLLSEIRDRHRALPISLGIAGPQVRARHRIPIARGKHCHTSTTSARCQCALPAVPEPSCKLQMSVGTTGH